MIDEFVRIDYTKNIFSILSFFFLLPLHFPHVSRKVLCISVVWSFLCSRRICLMYWGIKCPWVWQFHFFFSLTWISARNSWFVSLAANGVWSITILCKIVIFIEYFSRNLSTQKILNTLDWRFTKTIRLWIGSALVFRFWRRSQSWRTIFGVPFWLLIMASSFSWFKMIGFSICSFIPSTDFKWIISSSSSTLNPALVISPMSEMSSPVHNHLCYRSK